MLSVSCAVTWPYTGRALHQPRTPPSRGGGRGREGLRCRRRLRLRTIALRLYSHNMKNSNA
eukprot:scaffold17231_cov32-Tisochrysis_lutea.AAC.1